MPLFKCFSCMKVCWCDQDLPSVASGGCCPYCSTLITDINRTTVMPLSGQVRKMVPQPIAVRRRPLPPPQRVQPVPRQVVPQQVAPQQVVPQQSAQQQLVPVPQSTYCPVCLRMSLSKMGVCTNPFCPLSLRRVRPLQRDDRLNAAKDRRTLALGQPDVLERIAGALGMENTVALSQTNWHLRHRLEKLRNRPLAITGDSLIVTAEGQRLTVKQCYSHYHPVFALLDKAFDAPFAMLVKAGQVFGAFGTVEPGCSAVLNLVQNVCHAGRGAQLNGGVIFANYVPTTADLGVLSSPLCNYQTRLVYSDKPHDLLFLLSGSRLSRQRLKAVCRLSVTAAKQGVALESPNEDATAKAALKALGALPKPFNEPAPIPLKPRALKYADLKCGYSQLLPQERRLFDSIYMSVAYVLASPLTPSAQPHMVGVVLVTHDGRIATWGYDAAPHLHGETCAIKMSHQIDARLLRECRLYTSLEPCIMCAGLLTHVGVPLGMTVLSGLMDPGVHKQFVMDKPLRAADTFLEVSPLPLELVEVPYKNTNLVAMLEAARQKLSIQHKATLKRKEVPSAKWHQYDNSIQPAMAKIEFSGVLALAALVLRDMEKAFKGLPHEGFLVDRWERALDFLGTFFEGGIKELLEKASKYAASLTE